mmetsp:Transcript_4930/g.3891  ORF Transcript_4930/g.3891 Transcript_4930/m.3891 type:complete len:92 (+) Transcript_4930:67-342(+)
MSAVRILRFLVTLPTALSCRYVASVSVRSHFGSSHSARMPRGLFPCFYAFPLSSRRLRHGSMSDERSQNPQISSYASDGTVMPLRSERIGP